MKTDSNLQNSIITIITLSRDTDNLLKSFEISWKKYFEIKHLKVCRETKQSLI